MLPTCLAVLVVLKAGLYPYPYPYPVVAYIRHGELQLTTRRHRLRLLLTALAVRFGADAAAAATTAATTAVDAPNNKRVLTHPHNIMRILWPTTFAVSFVFRTATKRKAEDECRRAPLTVDGSGSCSIPSPIDTDIDRSEKRLRAC
ncbi:hypothetical protein ACLKA7_002584 [Drosophila subpalustris]